MKIYFSNDTLFAVVQVFIINLFRGMEALTVTLLNRSSYVSSPLGSHCWSRPCPERFPSDEKWGFPVHSRGRRTRGEVCHCWAFLGWGWVKKAAVGCPCWSSYRTRVFGLWPQRHRFLLASFIIYMVIYGSVRRDSQWELWLTPFHGYAPQLLSIGSFGLETEEWTLWIWSKGIFL